MRKKLDDIFNEKFANKLQDAEIKVEPLVEPIQTQLSPTRPFTSHDNHKRVFLSYSPILSPKYLFRENCG